MKILKKQNRAKFKIKLSSVLTRISARATNGKAVRLIVRIAVDRRVGRVQVPSPGIRTRGRRRPEVQIRRAIVEGTIRIPVAWE